MLELFCFDFCATSDEYLLPSSGFHLLVSSGESPMLYGLLSFVPDFNTRFVAICGIYEFAVCRYNKW